MGYYSTLTRCDGVKTPQMTGSCWTCGRVFTFNPVKVPSVRDGNGVRQPICSNCMRLANKMRTDKSMVLFPIPDDAYEACDEMKLG